MRIAIVDESPARAAVIEEGLHEAGLHDIVILTERSGLIRKLFELAPDVVLIDLANPSRDALEESFILSRSLGKPIAMFVDQSDEAATSAAVDAGVSAYIVDGLRKERIKPILDLAVRRFHAFSKLQEELTEARGALADRLAIDKAKIMLMKKRKIDEATAYGLLRSHAMDSNRRIAEVANALLTAEKLMEDRG